jgi:hypothetical protein
MSHGGFGAGASFGQGGFSGGGLGCLPGQPCMNGGWFCPPTASLCVRCESKTDCQSYSHLQFCSSAIGLCVECENDRDCGVDQVCHPITLRCAHRCQTSTDCGGDTEHPVCDQGVGACVECMKDLNCQVGHPYCEFYTCVECNQSNANAAPGAAAQCPIDKPYCNGLRCQSRPH